MICKRLRSTEKDAVVAQVNRYSFFCFEYKDRFILLVIRFKGIHHGESKDVNFWIFVYSLK